MSQNGKGDTPRPLAVPRDIYAAEYERIFGHPPRHSRTLLVMDEVSTLTPDLFERLRAARTAEDAA